MNINKNQFVYLNRTKRLNLECKERIGVKLFMKAVNSVDILLFFLTVL